VGHVRGAPFAGPGVVAKVARVFSVERLIGIVFLPLQPQGEQKTIFKETA